MITSLKFLCNAFGIFICYFYYGILQEAITKGKYVLQTAEESKDQKEVTEPFVYTLSLVFIQCAVSYTYASILLRTVHKVAKKHDKNDDQSGSETDQEKKSSQSHPIDRHVLKFYAICSLTYLLAMICSNWALQWVPYPTQVVGKSCKPIPVMILGVLIGGRSYGFKKYLFVLMIVAGVALFMYKPNKSINSAGKTSATILGVGVGELLLIMSLSMDGVTGAIQERLRAVKSSKPTNSSEMMRMLNWFAFIYTFIALLVTGEIFRFVQFTIRHPAVIWEIGTFAIANSLGQFFIFKMISDFGPLPCSVVTTTRKFFTVLASVLLFGNVLEYHQWIGASVVFIGLGLDVVYGK